MIKHIGFTGTRHGMTDAQRVAVDITIANIVGGDIHLQVVAHHGDCVGADAKFHELARQYGCAVCVHPPTDKTFAANIEECQHIDGTRTLRRAPASYLTRNRHIVEESDVMIATPREAKEGNSGTWSTIRATRRANKPLALVLPDGTVTLERWPG